MPVLLLRALDLYEHVMYLYECLSERSLCVGWLVCPPPRRV